MHSGTPLVRRMNPTGRYSTRLITDTEGLDAVADDWDRLWAAHPHARVDQHLDFLHWDHPDDDGQSRVWAVVLEDDERLAGVAPLILGRRELKWGIRVAHANRVLLHFSMTSAEFCGDELIAPDDSAARRALIDGLLAACRQF